MEGKHGPLHASCATDDLSCFGDRIENSIQSKSDTEKKERPTLMVLNA
jgi:hypothetical protein